MWSPSVTQSTPAAISLRYCAGLSPDPSAAFSALAMTRSRRSRRLSPWSAVVTIRRPTPPTMSPMRRTRISMGVRGCEGNGVRGSNLAHSHPVTLTPSHLPGHLRESRLPHHGHLDLARISQLLLERLGDVAADFGGLRVVRVLGAGDHPQLAAGLDGEGLLDAREAAGDGLQLLHPFDVPLERFAAGAGAGGAARIGRGHEHCVRIVGDDLVVMAEGGVYDLGFLTVPFEQVGPDLGMAALQLVVGRLADVVQEAA